VTGANLLATPLCDRLGIQLPIIQAPHRLGGHARAGRGGGLGMLALTWVTPQEAADRIRQVRQLTDRPVGVNLVLAFPIGDLLAACLAEGVPIVSTFWGDPAPVTGRVQAAGALHLHTVATAEEARRAVDAGVDVVVAQGWEAGGHVWGQVATMALVPAVVDAVAPVPVIAAGGIGDGRGWPPP
jgi:NAD(P)H-dependent flavin oxidoreductase YrpB (nitropropane dioxygenase family)